MIALINAIAAYRKAHTAWLGSACCGNLSCDIPEYAAWTQAIEAVISHRCDGLSEVTLKAGFILSSREVMEVVEDDPDAVRSLLHSLVGVQTREAT
jgi:hypothetical protein